MRLLSYTDYVGLALGHIESKRKVCFRRTAIVVFCRTCYFTTYRCPKSSLGIGIAIRLHMQCASSIGNILVQIVAILRIIITSLFHNDICITQCCYRHCRAAVLADIVIPKIVVRIYASNNGVVNLFGHCSIREFLVTVITFVILFTAFHASRCYGFIMRISAMSKWYCRGFRGRVCECTAKICIGAFHRCILWINLSAVQYRIVFCIDGLSPFAFRFTAIEQPCAPTRFQ